MAPTIKSIHGMLTVEYSNQFTRFDKDQMTVHFELFRDICADIDPSVLYAAAMGYMAEGHEWAPKAGQLRERAIALQSKGEGKPKLPDVAQAWVQAREYCSAFVRFAEFNSKGIYHEIHGGELVPVSFEQCDFYPKALHAAVIDACKVIGITRIFYNDPMDASAEGTLFAQFKATYGTVHERMDKAETITHPLIAKTISDIAARLKAPGDNDDKHSNSKSIQATQRAVAQGGTLRLDGWQANGRHA